MKKSEREREKEKKERPQVNGINDSLDPKIKACNHYLSVWICLLCLTYDNTKNCNDAIHVYCNREHILTLTNANPFKCQAEKE